MSLVKTAVSIVGTCLALMNLFEAPGSAADDALPKPIVVISDLHLNVGVFRGESWHPLEDFRWPRAFDAFLTRLNEEFPDGVDLVIAGDILELWQHPSLPCAKLSDTECGCSMAEMKQLVEDVISGHALEFASFGRFLSRETNRVYITPGNHDAALMDNAIWTIVQQAIPQQGRERFIRVSSGTWTSLRGQVVVEHGHQQTYDANYFPTWPKVIKECSGTQRFFRPWGENFVQSLYNPVEEKFPIVDNMVPESLGVKLYSEYRGWQGKRFGDIAKFIIFNLLQTSMQQKLGFLETHKDRRTLTKTDLEFCRKCLGEQLVTRSLPSDDPTRRELERLKSADPVTKETDDDLKTTIREQVFSLDDESIRTLCERTVLLEGEIQANPELAADRPVCIGNLGTVINKLFDPNGTHILRERISSLKRTSPALTVYVFGHTHEAKRKMEVETEDGTKIDAYNTGAFQRLIDSDSFTAKAAKYKNQIEAFERLTHDDMDACYSAVFIAFPNDVPTAELRQWSMQESDSTGKFLEACDSKCGSRPGNCPKE